MKKNHIDYFITVIGLVLFGAGLYFVKTLTNPQGIMQTLPYICIGVGCGIFGHGLGNIISRKAIKSSPHIQKQMEIEKGDERNIAIGNRAKAKAYDMMVFVYGAVTLSFTLMGIDMVAILMLVLSYLFVIFYGIYYRCKYEKEM